MFTLKTEIDGHFVMANLILEIGGIKLDFTPEDCEWIRYVDVTAESGEYDTNPSNGTFYIAWTPKYIALSSAKFGRGDGGELSVRIPSTPELLASLRDALTKWKAAVAENDFVIS